MINARSDFHGGWLVVRGYEGFLVDYPGTSSGRQFILILDVL
jgi:hypothetical protein